MNPLMFCQILASYTIIGAVEYAPNLMRIEFLDPTQEVAWMFINKTDYKECTPLLNNHPLDSL